MYSNSGRRRAPLSPLQSNTLGRRTGSKVQQQDGKPKAAARLGSDPPASSLTAEKQQQQAPTSSSGSRIPAAPASSVADMQRPGSATCSRIPRASEFGRSAGSPLPAMAVDEEPALGRQPSVFFSHVNPTFDGGPGQLNDLEEAYAASPALSWRTEVSGRDLTPGMLDQAVYTPATARSIQAWLRANTPTRRGAAGPAGHQLSGGVRPTAAGQTPLSCMPTPEVWQILEHMHQPPTQLDEGMYNIVNAYLRTGAQVLSPEPGCEGGAAIPAPAYMAAVVNKGGLLRGAPAAALVAASPEDPDSIRSSSVSSCNAAPASASPAPSTQPPAVGQGEEAGPPQCITFAPPVYGHDDVLPGEAGAAGRRSGPPSPISFNLPADSSPDTSPTPSSRKMESPTFSFGMGAGQAAQGKEGAPAGAAPAPEMARVESNESVDQPNPFKAMLSHLRGPQYASPAPAMLPHPASPKSPEGCSPVVLQPGEALNPALATPELGKGSLTHWIDRRGLSQALNTPARLDLQLLWAAMRDNHRVRSEADEVRHENVALGRELECVQALLRELGVEYNAAVEAAEANQAYAEAELAKAREAARQMMELSNQIQHMFSLCEAEKAELMGELVAAQQRLVDTEAGAANLADLEQAELEEQIEDARLAVAAAQRAADLAEARANDACSELCAIKAELQATQEQLAGMQAEAQASPMAALRSKLQGVQHALAGLHSKHAMVPAWSPSVDAKRLELQQLLTLSKEQLGLVQALLGGEDEVAHLKSENQALRQQLQEARALLMAHTPASAKQQERDMEMHALFGSPTPLRLSAEFALVSEAPSSEGSASLASGSLSLAGSSTGGSPALSDLFSSPYIVSQGTLTVDYRELHGAVLADTAASRALTPALTPEGSEECMELGSPMLEAPEHGNTAQQGFTVMHNHFIVTNVPASEVSKVQSMVQYWEAVACGRVLPGSAGEQESEVVSDAGGLEGAELQALGAMLPLADLLAGRLEAAAAESVADVATFVPAAPAEGFEDMAPLAVTAASPQELCPQLPAEECAEAVVAAPEITPPHATQEELRSHPLETPFTAIAASWTPAGMAGSDGGRCTTPIPSPTRLPEGLAVTPVASEEEAAATPARLTPVNFAAAVPGTPHTTPTTTGTASSLSVTPLSLSALRRAGSSDMQAAVRNRLQRLKMDLQKAQAKLQSVDQGLAAIVVSPACSLTSTPTMGRRSPATPTTAQKVTPFQVEGESETGSPVSAVGATAVERLAACISQPAAAEATLAATPACQPAPPQADSAAEPQKHKEWHAENEDVNTAVVAAAAACQSAGAVPEEGAAIGSCSKPPVHACTPGRAAPAGYVSPVAGSTVRRSPPGSAVRRTSPAMLRSAVKAAPSPLRRAALDSDSESDSSDDEDLFDRSRMAIHATAATPKAAKTPLAHPEGPGTTPQSMAFSSTSSFSPPEPLALMSVKPINRVRRAPCGLAAGRRRPTETEEREFRRRAAALKIQISPYFKRR